MSEGIDYEKLRIIGSTVTTSHDDVPRRLSPIYERLDEQDVVYIPLDEESDDPPRLACESRSHLLEMATAGDAMLFDEPIPARPDHWLMQIAMGRAPEYIPARDVHERLRRACREALALAAAARLKGDIEAAEEAAWYARRANRDDPLPLLILEDLGRNVRPESEMRFLRQDLAEYEQPLIDAARRRAATDAELHGLLPEPCVPPYLSAIPSKPGSTRVPHHYYKRERPPS